MGFLLQTMSAVIFRADFLRGYLARRVHAKKKLFFSEVFWLLVNVRNSSSPEASDQATVSIALLSRNQSCNKPNKVTSRLISKFYGIQSDCTTGASGVDATIKLGRFSSIFITSYITSFVNGVLRAPCLVFHLFDGHSSQ